MFDMLRDQRRREPQDPGSIAVSIALHGVLISLFTLGAGAAVLATENVAEGLIYLAPPPTITAGPEPETSRLTFAHLPGAGGEDARSGDGGYASALELGIGTPEVGRRAGAETVPALQQVADNFAFRTDSVYLSSQVDNPVAYHAGSAAPVYPDSLRLAGVEGLVEAQFVVDTLGRVEPGSFVLIESTHRRFTQAVREALPGMLFHPAILNGRRTKQLVHLPFVFRIEHALPAEPTVPADTTAR